MCFNFFSFAATCSNLTCLLPIFESYSFPSGFRQFDARMCRFTSGLRRMQIRALRKCRFTPGLRRMQIRALRKCRFTPGLRRMQIVFCITHRMFYVLTRVFLYLKKFVLCVGLYTHFWKSCILISDFYVPNL